MDARKVAQVFRHLTSPSASAMGASQSSLHAYALLVDQLSDRESEALFVLVSCRLAFHQDDAARSFRHRLNWTAARHDRERRRAFRISIEQETGDLLEALFAYAGRTKERDFLSHVCCALRVDARLTYEEIASVLAELGAEERIEEACRNHQHGQLSRGERLAALRRADERQGRRRRRRERVRKRIRGVLSSVGSRSGGSSE